MEFISVPEAGEQAFTLPPSILIIVAVIGGLILLYSVLIFSNNRARIRREMQQESTARMARIQGTAQTIVIPENASFKAKQIITPDALEVLELIETAVWEINSSFSVLVHCAMNRFLTLEGNASPVERDRINLSLKSEVLDYLVIDAEGLPVLGVIYYTYGPSNSPRTSQDPGIHVIISALNHAGVRLFEVEPGFRVREFKKRIRMTLKSSIL